MLRKSCVSVLFLSILLMSTGVFAEKNWTWNDGGITARGGGQPHSPESMGTNQQIKQINIVAVKGGQANATANSGTVTNISGRIVSVRDTGGATRTFEIDSAAGLNLGDMVRWHNRADWVK